ncbi:MAG: serine/threonine protein kinase [Chloroflexota bacterium]|nr:serine/threonine protein kinase [Chloroflexota bacterium]
MVSQQCPLCASYVSDNARVCPTCGAPLDKASSNGTSSPATDALPPGTTLNNNAFSLGRTLGRGGFGITYLGADLRLKRSVAIKEFFPAGSTRRATSVLLPGTLSRADYELAMQKFMQEAQMLARFRHPSIVNVYEVFQANDTAYMVMEYLQGENLLERMDRRGAPLTEAELVTFTGPISEALDEVHAAGVLHRDIKPENIMLVGPESSPRPVLIDFGAAREFASGMVNRHSIVLTPGYAPLEQYGEQARRGPFTDVYALAATLYHVATGEQPPAATERALGITVKPPSTLNPALSTTFEGALMHGLALKVDQRPQTALLFYRELPGGSPAPQAHPEPTTPGPRTRPPTPPPAPAPARSHIERVSQIARVLSSAGPVQTDHFLCPVCRGADMVDSALSAAGILCPVCHRVSLQPRFAASDALLCPSCSTGQIEPVSAQLSRPNSLMRCPACRTGEVRVYARSQMLVVPDLWARCDRCGADFDYHTQNDSLTLMELPSGPGLLGQELHGQTRSRAEWAALAGDAGDTYYCGVCHSEFRSCGPEKLEWVARGGNPRQVPVQHQGQCWSRLLWAKLAHHVPVNDGTVVCPSCDAQFDESSPGQLTLLRTSEDPFGTVAAHRGRTYPAAKWRALATGGRAPSRPGLVCPSCTAQLETTGQPNRYELASYDQSRDPYGTGSRYQGQQLGVGDWRRVAAGGVPADEEQRLRQEAHREFWAAMLAGEVSTSPAAETYPFATAPDEEVVITFPAVQIRSRFGFLYGHDEGQLWLTTKQLVYQGQRGDVVVPLREAAGCQLLDTGQDGSIIEIQDMSGSALLRFSITVAPLEFEGDGLALQLRWDESAFIELFESLRRRT